MSPVTEAYFEPNEAQATQKGKEGRYLFLSTNIFSNEL